MEPDRVRLSLAGRKGAHTMWSRTVDRSARTESARAASPTSAQYWFDRQPAEFVAAATVEQRWAAAESARKAWFVELAMRSATARSGNASRARGRRRRPVIGGAS